VVFVVCCVGGVVGKYENFSFRRFIKQFYQCCHLLNLVLTCTIYSSLIDSSEKRIRQLSFEF